MISDRNTARGVRKYGRVTVDANVRVLHAQGATTARTCDIGCGGMSFLAPLELAEGKIVHLEFQLPYSNSPFRVMAVVKNRNGLRYGVEFQELTPDQFGEIARVTAILSFSQA